jgi:Protein of unknown function (DUF3311)
VVQRTGAAPGLRHLGMAQQDWRNRIGATDFASKTICGICFSQIAEALCGKRARGATPMDENRERAWSPWYLLLLIQFIPALAVPFYNRAEPAVAGIPFFYWFQLALVLVSAVVTATVYFATESSRNG